jgi:hypothetical protein
MRWLILLPALLLGLATTTALPGQVAEICGNGIDDDGDGLIDCEDPDCSFPLFSAGSYGDSNSQDVALGDLDGDGDLDAWVANYGQTKRVWINQGGDQGGTPGTYADSGQTLASSTSEGVALGDLDGDGDLDALIANNGSQANRVWINQGGDQGGTPGTYSTGAGGQALGNSYSQDVALGDLDGDGDLDAWVANANNQANRVWINQGGVQGGIPGTYADTGQALGNSGSFNVALGDLDGDGDLDAWVANCCRQANRVWINQGGDQGGTPGTYADSGQALGSSYSQDVALGDLDGDGDLDAWVANESANRAWINQGGIQGGTPGTYADSGQALGNSQSWGVDLGDVDGDGDLDAWVTNINQPKRVWINQGGDQGGTLGTYADSGQALANSFSSDVSLGDVDGDGDLDAWVANIGEANRVWINDGLGNFADSSQALGNSNSDKVALGDLDGDGDLDAWVANNVSQANRVWINNGLGNFTDSGQSLGNSDSTGVALGDLDGDGDLDAWVANYGGQANRVWINDGFGNFTDSGQALGNSQNYNVALGDLDGDGDLDAWVVNCCNQPNRMWINDGLGNFVDSGQALGNSYSTDVALGDLDGDGDLDAWVANFNGQPNRVWLNDGLGNFVDSSQALGTSYSYDVILGDLDGDDDLDAWVANGAQANRVWINDGLGNFAESSQALGNSSSFGVDLGDLDGDGDLDAWVANFDNQPDRIWLNNGLGNFADSGQSLGNYSSYGVALGDLDGDGDLDAWVANYYNQPNRVFMNLSPCSPDLDADGIPNDCDIDQTLGPDCDGNGEDDSCQVDTDGDGLIDPCDDDIDGDGIPNDCDLDLGGEDCDGNGIADNCDEDLNSDGIPDACQDPIFRRGDANGDGAMDIADGIIILGYLFGTSAIDCFDAADANDDGNLNIADAIATLAALFNGGPLPPSPGPNNCDLDPTDDFLGCGSYDGC